MPENRLKIQAEPVGRTPNGRFAKGASGNAVGKPRGSRNRATQIAEAMC
jgi:uncharacterized protein DUF5681